MIFDRTRKASLRKIGKMAKSNTQFTVCGDVAVSGKTSLVWHAPRDRQFSISLLVEAEFVLLRATGLKNENKLGVPTMRLGQNTSPCVQIYDDFSAEHSHITSLSTDSRSFQAAGSNRCSAITGASGSQPREPVFNLIVYSWFIMMMTKNIQG